MNILVIDKIAESGIAAMQEAGHAVQVQPSLSGSELPAVLKEGAAQVLIVRSTQVTAEALEASPELELIVRAGAGYDTIDVEGAARRGVFVANCPGQNAVAVAELTMGLIIDLDRSLSDNVIDARAGRWNKAAYAGGTGLKGRAIGIIGLGSIGQEVARRAKAFEMEVIAWSRSLTSDRAEQLGLQRRDSPLEVARDADVVSLHVASTPETRHLADARFFDAMQENAFFVNTSRSAVVDEDALRAAMDEKNIRAGVDLLEDEPAAKTGDLNNPLASHPNLYMTHHIGASTQQAQDATAREAVRVVQTYDDSGHVPNCVNLATQTPATYQLTVRHLDKVGVLAAVLDEMQKADWNIQEMDNLIFEGAEAACAHMRIDGEMDNSVVERIANHDDVLAVSVISL